MFSVVICHVNNAFLSAIIAIMPIATLNAIMPLGAVGGRLDRLKLTPFGRSSGDGVINECMCMCVCVCVCVSVCMCVFYQWVSRYWLRRSDIAIALSGRFISGLNPE